MFKLFNVHRAKYLLRALSRKNKLDVLRLIELRTLKKRTRLGYYNFPPSTMQIELTNRCNMRCKWCYRENLEILGKVGDMPMEPLLKLLEQCRGVRLLHLFGEGESLMYPGIIEVIRHAAKYVKCPSVTTNGTMLRHLGKDLAESGLGELSVSIDATDPETFREIRKVELGRIVDNMSYFASISKIPMRINAVVSADNLDSLRNMPELAASIGNVKELHFQGLHESGASKEHGFSKLRVESPRVLPRSPQSLHEPLRRDRLHQQGRLPLSLLQLRPPSASERVRAGAARRFGIGERAELPAADARRGLSGSLPPLVRDAFPAAARPLPGQPAGIRGTA
jgi:pyruvate-formate lyase-activating enzyme